MKLAITGKGGVGKTTVAAALTLLYSKDGRKVIAIDADPDANLGATLGLSDAERVAPVIEMKELIAERTQAGGGKVGSYFKLNPKVDDIPERFSKSLDNIKLMAMGSVKKGGGGCVCPENAFVRTLLAHLLFEREDVVILDMEAGIEHLGRGTASGVDAFLVVVEPDPRAISTARKIENLASDLKVKNIFVVCNKVRGEKDREFLEEALKGLEVLGSIDYDENLLSARGNLSKAGRIVDETKRIKTELDERVGARAK